MAEKLPSCQNVYFSVLFSNIEEKTASEGFSMGNKKQGNSAMHLEAPKVFGLGKAGCKDVGQDVSFGQGENIFIVIKWQR